VFVYIFPASTFYSLILDSIAELILLQLPLPD